MWSSFECIKIIGFHLTVLAFQLRAEYKIERTSNLTSVFPYENMGAVSL